MSKRAVLLLQPRVGDMDDFRDRPTPPMGLLHAASRVAASYDVLLVDQRTEKDWRSKVRDALASRPILAGITTMSGPMIGKALEMARYVRSCSDVPVVWGGTHVTMVPQQTVTAPEADFVVLGEGEESLRILVDRLAEGREALDIPGVWARRRRSGTVHRNARGSPLDFAKLGPAPYDIVDMEKYGYTHRGKRTFDYLSSRGCPHACTYCYNTVFRWRNWSGKPAHVVGSELSELRKRYEFDVVYFLDDNFFVDRKRAWEIAGLMKSMGLQFEIQGVDIQSLAEMSDEELDRLEESGLVRLTVGVETASDRLRKLVGKWGDSAQVLATLKRLAGRRFLVLTSFIVGFPTESKDELRHTVRLAMYLQYLGSNFRLPQFYNFTPVQGTALGRRLEAEGFAFPETLEEWKDFDWDRNLVFKSDPRKRRELEAVAFLSKFLDRKCDDYGARPFVASLYKLYRPAAFARLYFGLYRFLPERAVYRLAERLL